jgi:photosystem II stability/assembly factor-like uncharacterized protein
MKSIRCFCENKKIGAGYYNSVSISGNGKYQTLVQRAQSDATCPQGNLLTSCDSGKNFTVRLQGLNLTGVAVSSCGRYQTAVVQGNSTTSPPELGFIYNSSDYGKTWIQNEDAPSNGWYGVAVSGNGQYQLALPNTYKSPPNNGFLYTSSDFGQTWVSRKGPGEQLWLNGAIDKSGKTQVAVVFGTLPPDGSDALPGHVWISRDYGITWDTVPSLSDYFTCIAISSCGNHITAGAQNCFFAPAIPKPLYVSSDGGTNWLILNSNTDNWLNIAMSGDGQYQCALSYKQEADSILSGYVYQSEDYGQTWKRNKSLPQKEWTSNAISIDGTVQTLVATLCGGVYQQQHQQGYLHKYPTIYFYF